MRVVLSTLLLLLLAPLGASSFAQDRAAKVALIIANDSYVAVPGLTNPLVDAGLVSASLKEAGFIVTRVDNADHQTLRRALLHFRSVAATADFALVYFAGHGVQISGENWLLPIDATFTKEGLDVMQLIPVRELADSISTATTRILVLDACRNDLSASASSHSPAQGLAAIEISDVLVLFSAGSGQVAIDGDGQGSPFARSFAQRIIQRGIDLRFIAGQIRDDVATSTSGRQRPYVAASFGGARVVINEGEPDIVEQTPPPLSTPAAWIVGCWAVRDNSVRGLWQRGLLRMEGNRLIVVGNNGVRFIDVVIATLAATDTVVEAPRQHLEFEDQTFEMPRTVFRRAGALLEVSYTPVNGTTPVLQIYDRCPT